MSDRDEHLVALQGIWSEVKALNGRVNEVREDLGKKIDSTNARLDSTNARLDSTNARLDSTNERLGTTNERLERLEKRQTESEVRIATELVAVVGAVHEVRDLLKESRLDRHRLDSLEHRVEALEMRANRPA